MDERRGAPGPPRLLFGGADGTVLWRRGTLAEANALLVPCHYLGSSRSARVVFVGELAGALVAAQVWRWPSARYLPADGTWLELARWCLTMEAGCCAGSRMHAWAVRWLRRHLPGVTTLVSYSDPAQGHRGALYKACNWQWAPTWHRLTPPPTGNGRWTKRGVQQSVKDRWVFVLHPDPRRAAILAVKQ